LGLPEEPRGVSGYAAGREGFWLQRFFVSQSRETVGVDAASLEGTRRSRRAKTDRLDGHQLRTMLRRQAAGAQQGWRVVRVPSGVDEDRRQRPRERLPTKRARPRVLKRRKGRLAG